MKTYIISNIFANKIYTCVLLKFLNCNLNWIFQIAIPMRMFVCIIPSDRIAFRKKLLHESKP